MRNFSLWYDYVSLNMKNNSFDQCLCKLSCCFFFISNSANIVFYSDRLSHKVIWEHSYLPTIFHVNSCFLDLLTSVSLLPGLTGLFCCHVIHGLVLSWCPHCYLHRLCWVDVSQFKWTFNTELALHINVSWQTLYDWTSCLSLNLLSSITCVAVDVTM